MSMSLPGFTSSWLVRFKKNWHLHHMRPGNYPSFDDDKRPDKKKKQTPKMMMILPNVDGIMQQDDETSMEKIVPDSSHTVHVNFVVQMHKINILFFLTT